MDLANRSQLFTQVCLPFSRLFARRGGGGTPLYFQTCNACLKWGTGKPAGTLHHALDRLNVWLANMSRISFCLLNKPKYTAIALPARICIILFVHPQHRDLHAALLCSKETSAGISNWSQDWTSGRFVDALLVSRRRILFLRLCDTADIDSHPSCCILISLLMSYQASDLHVFCLCLVFSCFGRH